VPGLPNQLYAACNPGAPSHFLAVRFGLAGGAQPQPGCKAVLTKTIDNPYLPKDYVDDLNRLTGVARKRFFEGLWAGSDRLVYDTWTRPVHVKQREGPWRRTVVGVDVGYTNAGCMVLLHVDGDGRIHQPLESYEPRVLPREWLTRAREWYIKFGPEAFAIDPSSPDVIAEWRNAGLPAVAANNERAEGVRIVRAHLATAGDGKPRLTVDPTCTNTIREFETWECKPESDDFTKENDHAMDALRYAVMHLAADCGPARRTIYRGW
jgi:phage terminase large subunit